MKPKKVLLVMPNYRRIYKYVSEEATMVEPPLGLAYIAAFLRRNKIPVKILDAAALDFSHEQIKDYVDNLAPDVIGISSTTILIEETYKLAKLLKNKEREVVVGGPHTSILPERTLKECAEIDIVAVGEGEETMLEIASGNKLSGIKGIYYRVGKRIKANKCRELIKNLDSLPFPARDLLPLDKYYSIGTRRSPNATLVTSRGCPYNCNFCVNRNVLGKGFRYRGIENVVAEIDELVKKFGIKEIDIIDDNFTLIPERAEKICDEIIKRRYDLIWKLGNGVRADRVNESLMKKMKQAGCYSIAFGIETGNREILKRIEKGETMEDIEKAVKLAKKYKILTTGFFIIGNLGDNEKTMQETIDFAKKLDLDIAQFQVFIPIPGSPYTKIIEKEGKVLADSWSDYGAFKKPIFIHKDLTPELMEKMQKKAYHDYYIRPKMILRKMLEIRTFKQFVAYAKSGLAVLKMNQKEK